MAWGQAPACSHRGPATWSADLSLLFVSFRWNPGRQPQVCPCSKPLSLPSPPLFDQSSRILRLFSGTGLSSTEVCRLPAPQPSEDPEEQLDRIPSTLTESTGPWGSLSDGTGLPGIRGGGGSVSQEAKAILTWQFKGMSPPAGELLGDSWAHENRTRKDPCDGDSGSRILHRTTLQPPQFCWRRVGVLLASVCSFVGVLCHHVHLSRNGRFGDSIGREPAWL